ncbi:2Fe-2S ferredoxin-type iron-sulfur binding domain [Dillenia turbinata]|uniref:2Fe-2S ferredoxin-type iron-sulfur binding domain n=1 Tax=Dillenia turbinata TaxID=194707 RepID=A0AAN8YYZ1_9MAGN
MPFASFFFLIVSYFSTFSTILGASFCLCAISRTPTVCVNATVAKRVFLFCFSRFRLFEWLRTIMFISKFARFGARAIRGLTTIGTLAAPPQKAKCLNFSSRPHWQPHMHRAFSTSSTDKSNEEGDKAKEMISVTFVEKDGEEKHIKVPVGMSMLEAAHENDIELEGACEGSLACSTCHVIVMDMEYYNKLEDPIDEENDMLDLAFGLSETSRLGCQVIAKPELDGLRLALPAATRNFAVDGYVPKPH